MDTNFAAQIEEIKKRIQEEEKSYRTALNENKSYPLLKGQRLILRELRKQLYNVLAKYEEKVLRFDH
jgi:hypothetical protein